MTEREYDKLIAAISGHFLTQELPDNWRDFSLEYLEEFITESATETYEYWHWAGLLSLIEEVAHTVKEFMEKEKNQWKKKQKEGGKRKKKGKQKT